MTELKKILEPEGAPLAVCVNDCELDYGQRPEDLAKICFRLGCAFAEMRWGIGTALCREPIKLIPRQAPHERSGSYKMS